MSSILIAIASFFIMLLTIAVVLIAGALAIAGTMIVFGNAL